jgi:sulfatase modifying factor 1
MASVRASVLFLFAVLSGSAQTSPARLQGPSKPPVRRALLIGNTAYANLPRIPAASQELALIKSALDDAGFEVMLVENAAVPDFERVIPSFVRMVQPGDVCLFYFTGYAIQAEDRDYLLPVDFRPDLKGNLIARAYQATNFAKELERKNASLKLIFIEGARGIDTDVQDLSIPGLALPDVSDDITETLIGLPTAVNQIVQTPPSEVGLFSRALEDSIRRKGLSIRDLMPELKRQVADASGGAQQPTQAPNLTRNFYFHEPEKVSAGLVIGIPHQNRTDREEYVWIPAGKFLMGCVPGDQKCDKNEKPQHEVTISEGFWLGQNEVKVVSYRRYLERNGRRKPTDMPTGPFWDPKWRQEDRPISDMRWEDAAGYCHWAGGRLPTEAEWEYAARDGLPNEVYPLNSANSRDKANFYGKQGNDLFEYTAPVRSFDPLVPFQLFDMAGNVWEFVGDYYGTDYYENSPKVDPKGPDTGKQRVVRGGSFDSDPKDHLRISIRKPADRGNNIGFRCVLEVTPEIHQLLQIP